MVRRGAFADRHGDADVGVTGIRGEYLAAVEHPARAIFHRLGTHAPGVGAGFRFGERPRTDPLAGGQLRYVLAPLLVAAGDENVIGAQRIVRGHDQAHGRIDARKFLDDDGVLDVAESRSAEFLGKNSAQEAKLSGFLDHIERKDFLLIPFQDVRADFLLGKFADTLAKLNLLRREVKFHGG